MADPRPSRVHYEGGQPILRVENMEASLRFYVGVLGFTNAPWGNDDFTSVNRDRAGIYLCRGGQAPWGMGLARRGGRCSHICGIEVPRRAHPHGAEEPARGRSRCEIEDPDGNVLRLGSEPRAE